MTSIPYSERFVSDGETDGWHSYNVPAGKRAVLTCITIANPSEASGYVHVLVGGVRVYFRNFPASLGHEVVSLRAVCYAGEFLELYKAGLNFSMGLYGYLLEDPQSATRAPAGDRQPPARAAPAPPR